MKRSILLLFFFLCVSWLFGQQKPGTEEGNTAQTISSDEKTRTRLQLAMSNPAYPVTPGDVYKLSYNNMNTIVSFDVYVDYDLSVNLAIFGKINARGMVFSELRKNIEARVLAAYNDSLPDIIIKATGLFQVFVKGEVSSTNELTCWGLSRLQESVADMLTPFASRRDIEVISANGKSSRFDLFRAERFGEQEQNPYIKPGDTIIVHKYLRKVSLDGEIKRPGIYQLLPDDTLEKLIQVYGDGYTKLADTARVQIIRYDSVDKRIAQTLYFNLSSQTPEKITLNDMDYIHVSSITELYPVIYFEGAIGKSSAGGNEPVLLDTNQLQIIFTEGEMISTAINSVKGGLTPISDLRNAYIIRIEAVTGRSTVIPVNLENILYTYSLAIDVQLKAFDKIVIPFRQFFVTVGGAVYKPGRYPYIPSRTYQYYINLAGGFDPAKVVGEPVEITDVNNIQRNMLDIIQPEDKIFVPTNSFFYYLNQSAPIIGVLTSVAALTISIIQAIPK